MKKIIGYNSCYRIYLLHVNDLFLLQNAKQILFNFIFVIVWYGVVSTYDDIRFF